MKPVPPAGAVTMPTDEFTERRDKRDGDFYRLLQAQALLKLFEQDNGRPAETIDELEAWAARLEGPIDPYAVLTREEIESTMHEHKSQRR